MIAVGDPTSATCLVVGRIDGPLDLTHPRRARRAEAAHRHRHALGFLGALLASQAAVHTLSHLMPPSLPGVFLGAALGSTLIVSTACFQLTPRVTMRLLAKAYRGMGLDLARAASLATRAIPSLRDADVDLVTGDPGDITAEVLLRRRREESEAARTHTSPRRLFGLPGPRRDGGAHDG